MNNNIIIKRYHELYQIEQAFRISKSDLQIRPIFHYKEEAIKLHLLICFMALVISVYSRMQKGNRRTIKEQTDRKRNPNQR